MKHGTDVVLLATGEVQPTCRDCRWWGTPTPDMKAAANELHRCER
jgi:hypothetical protein